MQCSVTNQEITRRGILSKTAAGTVVSLAGCVGEEYMGKMDDGQIRTYQHGWGGEIEIFKTQTQAYIEIDIDYKTFTGESRSNEGYEPEPSLEVRFYSNIGYNYLWETDKNLKRTKTNTELVNSLSRTLLKIQR